MTGNRLHLLLRTLSLPALAAPLALAGPASASASLSVINASLSSVSCTSGTTCMAVGQIQVVPPSGIGIQHTFSESWNGTTWRVVPTPTLPPHTGAVLNSVSCTSTSDCMAVGNLGTAQNPAKFTLAEHWNGTAWTVVGTPPASGGTGLVGMYCTSPSACAAAGFASLNDGTGTQLTLAEQWNGTGWKMLDTPNPRGFGVSTMGGISCPAAAACMAVGSWTDPTGESSFNLAEAWNGTSWKVVKTPRP